MSFEETISSLLEAKLAPLVEANRRLTAQVENLRRALPTPLVSIAEASRGLGISKATVRRRIKDGSIPSRRVGRSVRVDLAAVQHPPTEEDALRFVGVTRQ